MLVIPETVRRAPRRQVEMAAEPTALTLVAATYVSGASVTLTFDRAIDLDAFDPNRVFVADGTVNETFQGEAFVAVGTNGVRVTYAEYDGGVPPGVRLTVEAGNGIVAADGGPAWAGCDEVALPFGA